ncbi:hypothetical protein PM023_16085 [Halorubrum ezzemoulense]|uniref:hypothetical protein n=1 Tax=Halorubrum ezzemoulense TaxID=337243 RepID=UPI00233116D3|nr:hypothetical protein [Halorubrum ezzemoulense]MDB2226166.1 hypothetical protein [Halorubrum ezzemoulense]
MVTVEVDEQVWRYLMTRKRPGDSHNDVLRRELGLDDSRDAEQPERPDTRREAGPVSHARDALADWAPADVDTAKARRATLAVVEWLATQDAPQQRADVLAWAEGRSIEGYAASTLWEKVVQPGLGELVDCGVVAHRRNVGYAIVEKDATEG